MDSAFAEIKLKLITPNGCISACGQVKNFIGIKSTQWVEWRLKKLLILAAPVFLEESHPERQSCEISHEISHWQDRARFWSASCEIFVRVIGRNDQVIGRNDKVVGRNDIGGGTS